MAFAKSVPRFSRTRPARPRSRRQRILRGFRWVALGVLVGLVAFVTGLLTAPVDLTPPPPPSQSAILLDANGEYFATIRAPEQRAEVAEDAIAHHMREAIVASEDARFLQHNGVDPIAIMRAAYRDLRAKGVRQGGSTITQQYVKNVYVGSDRTALRKIKEAAIAYRLEKQKTKREILTAYLNTLYLGNGTYGVEAAAHYYFNTTAAKLTLGQAAMLAGIAPAPSLYNPVRDFRRAKQRQFGVLDRMNTLGYITPAEASAAYSGKPNQPSDIARFRPPELKSEAAEYADMVRNELLDAVGEERLFREGIRVRTTLDLALQRATAAAAEDVLDAANPDDPDVAIAVIDPKTGDLKAVHSSRYVRHGYNLATQPRRSPGSVMKIFDLAAALKAGIKADDVFPNTSCFRYGRGTKDVACNYENTGGGSLTLRRAVERSSNTVFVRIGRQIGIDKIKATTEAMGVGGFIDPELGATVPIGGGVGFSALGVARGIGVIANGGVLQKTRLLLEVRAGGDPLVPFSGELVTPKAEARPKGTQVLDKALADIELDILKGVVTRGTGRAARQSFEVFGKTGSASNNTDAWFVGCGVGSPEHELCVAVWMGFTKQKPMVRIHGVASVTGGSLPARVFSAFWKRAAEFRAAAAAEAAGEAPSPAPTTTRRRTTVPEPVPAQTTEPVSTPSSAAPSPTPSRPRPFQSFPTANPNPTPSASATGPP